MLAKRCGAQGRPPSRQPAAEWRRASDSDVAMTPDTPTERAPGPKRRGKRLPAEAVGARQALMASLL